jgi:hypothetical protein
MNARLLTSSGHKSAPKGSIQASLLAASRLEPSPPIQLVIGKQSTSLVPMLFEGQRLCSAVVLLQNTVLQYPNFNDHWFRTITGGCSGWSLDYDGTNTSVTLFDALASWCDNTGHSQDNTESSVSFAVVGIPA